MRTHYLALPAVAVLLGSLALPADARSPTRLAPVPQGGAAAASPDALRVPVATEPSTGTPSTGTNVIVEAGSGRVITLPGPVVNVFVSDPKIAEVRPASPTSLFLFGVAAGHTSVAALDAGGHAVRTIEVTVRPSNYGATEGTGAIARSVPGSQVKLEAQPKRLVVAGHVATPMDANAAAAAATAFAADGQGVDNRVQVQQQIQVGLHVRIAEMSRNVTRNLGINWQALGQIGQIGNLAALSGTSGLNSATASTLSCAAASLVINSSCKGVGFSGMLETLAQDNLIHILAEPNLTAMSGETASFLVGGEFPIPIAQGGNTNAISVEYKQYGIGLAFVPTVFSEGRIRLHVRPEVSQLSAQGAVTLNGITIPSLTVRRAETTVELGSGESFAIAGLLSDQTNQTSNAIAGLGEIPILGALFRSDAFQHNQTELVIIVTPYIVKAVGNPAALHLPTDGFVVPNDIDRMLLLRQIGRGSADAAPHVPGQAGFVIQ